MKIINSSIVFENDLPQLSAKNAFFPNVIEISENNLVAVSVIGQAFESVDSASYVHFSNDNGKTWSKPKYFQKTGALPLLLRLDCGVTLAVITRPGIFIYASTDDGNTWEKCAEVMTDGDRSTLANQPPKRPNFHQWAGSCCNTDIYALSANRALLVYSDFYTPDAMDNGVKKKAIKTVEIAVDCNA